MIKESKWSQYGFPRTEADVQGITIHETGNYEKNAQELHDWLENVITYVMTSKPFKSCPMTGRSIIREKGKTGGTNILLR